MQLNKVFIAGHQGLVGRALLKRFEMDTSIEVIVAPRSELDLTDYDKVRLFFKENRPTDVVLAAARVGGIAANIAHPVRFLTENLAIQTNVMMSAVEFGVRSIMFLGSSCIYPRMAMQPIRESAFMTGPLEPTNESYAVAKIAGIRLAQAIHQEHGVKIHLPMPCNVIGAGDHFDLQVSHVASSLVKRFVDAKHQGAESVTLWGSGAAKREFILSSDLADACYFMFQSWDDPTIVNIGTGKDISIRDLAEKIALIVDYKGVLKWDLEKPEGMPRKVLDIGRIQRAGWSPKSTLDQGLNLLVNEYQQLAESNSKP
jgi:GDP-L-fucose synthase